ncbi:MAG: hypothetical protein AB9846_00465 [Tenuifilaceae bacterium]
MENIQLLKINTGVRDSIATGHLIDKETGYFLTKDSKLYKIKSDNTAQLITTPDNMIIKNLAFRNELEGIVIGYPKNVNPNENSSAMAWWLFSIAAVVLLVLSFGIYKAFRKWKLKFLYILIPIIGLVVYLLWPQEINWHLEKLEFTKGGGHYLSTKPLFRALTAITNDGGTTWKTKKILTNFDLTSVLPLGNSYYVTTYGRADHMDGDIICLYENKGKIVYKKFVARRGLSGIKTDTEGKIIAFGTEVYVTITPPSKMANTPGEVLILDENIDSLKTLDIEGKKHINSLCLTQDGTIWVVTLDMEIYKHTVDGWILKDSTGISNPFKIEFINPQLGFLLTKDGKLLYTNDAGCLWTDYTIEPGISILDMKKNNNTIQLFGTEGFVGIIEKK